MKNFYDPIRNHAAPDVKKLYSIRWGGYTYMSYKILPGASSPIYGALRDQCRDVFGRNFPSTPRYNVLADVSSETTKLLTLVYEGSSKNPIVFNAAVVIPTKAVGECLHLGLIVVDSNHRGQRIASLLTSGSLFTFFFLTQRLTFHLFNISSSAAIHHALVRYCHGAFPNIGMEKPRASSQEIAREFADKWRDEAHLRSDAPFCDELFVFKGGNNQNPFHRQHADKDIQDEAVKKYYEHRMDIAAGDVCIQIGRVTPLSLLTGNLRAQYTRSRFIKRIRKALVLRPAKKGTLN